MVFNQLFQRCRFGIFLCLLVYCIISFSIYYQFHLPNMHPVSLQYNWTNTTELSGHILCAQVEQFISIPPGNISGVMDLTPAVHATLENFYFNKVKYVKGCLSPSAFVTQTGRSQSYHFISRLWLATKPEQSISGRPPYTSPSSALVSMELNERFQLISPPFLLGIPFHQSHFTGAEDPRLFQLQNSQYGRQFALFGADVILNFSVHHLMHIWSLEKKKLFSLTLPQKLENEKNWSLLDLTTFQPHPESSSREVLYFIYTVFPLTVVQCELQDHLYGQSCRLFYSERNTSALDNNIHFSGGSSYYRLTNTNYFYSIIHSKGYQCNVPSLDRIYRNHIVVLHWPKIYQPFMRIVFIGEPLEFPTQFLSIKPPIHIKNGFAFVSSMFGINEQTDEIYLGVHRSDLECWAIQLRGMFQLIRKVVHEVDRMPCKERFSLEKFQLGLKKQCDKWTKKD